jgi:hypothetical protein
METGDGRGVEFVRGKEIAMLPLMIGMGVPVIAYALTRPDPPEADRQAGA